MKQRPISTPMGDILWDMNMYLWQIRVLFIVKSFPQNPFFDTALLRLHLHRPPSVASWIVRSLVIRKRNSSIYSHKVDLSSWITWFLANIKIKRNRREIGIPFSQQGQWTLPGSESPCPKMAHGLRDPMLMWICLPANSRTSAVLSAANTT